MFNFQVFSIEQANASASATRPNGMIWTNVYLVGLMSRIMKSEHSLALSQVSAKAKMSILLSTKLSLIWRHLLLIDQAFRRQRLSSFADEWCSRSCLVGTIRSRGGCFPNGTFAKNRINLRGNKKIALLMYQSECGVFLKSLELKGTDKGRVEAPI